MSKWLTFQDRHGDSSSPCLRMKKSWIRSQKTCKICGRFFTPSKYNTRQQVCDRKKCQKERIRRYYLKWERSNPDYFRGIYAKERSRKWREEHPGYYKEYRKKHSELRARTREYVREFRKKSLKAYL